MNRSHSWAGADNAPLFDHNNEVNASDPVAVERSLFALGKRRNGHRRRSRSLLLVLLCTVQLTAALEAQALPERVSPLQDEVVLLGPSTSEEVEREISSLEAATTAEIEVLIVATTEGEDPYEYATRAFDHRRIGKAEKDNGVLLLFALEEGRMELVPGARYQELFTQARAERLRRDVALPRMRYGETGKAVVALVKEVVREIRTFESPEEVALRFRRHSLMAQIGAISVLLGFVALAGTVFFWSFGRGIQLLPRWALLALFVLGGLATVAAAVWLWMLYRSTKLGLTIGILGAVGAALCTTLVQHICPECNRWLRMTNRVLRQATFEEPGCGAYIFECRHCGHDHDKPYEIDITNQWDSSGSGAKRDSWLDRQRRR